ncbi:TonB-dependent siderophore receptor [Rhodovibrio salinarum]|uniref:TonB-dependent siderophore receptor n=1 Tax=Rhodovibrio salinarum TaxID=1087 RepID=A0A934V0M8_9PROT|nr:TonB-dependent siderophore receptor [Rhodovibrio salinarum]MBK1697781.1 TonB-dependent siderophore receptor [Rhodovibrio salinarum]
MTVYTVSWRHRPSVRVLAAVLFSSQLAVPALAQEAGAEAEAASPAADSGAIELPEMVVTGSGYETETTDSYTTDFISVGEKDTRLWREVPQSTTVLTREYLEDRNASSLDTALRDAPGLLVLDNDNGRSSLYSRGFEFDSLSFNGLPAPLSSIYGTQPDMAIVDHVEILKGPSGLFAGAGEPAGAINMHLKRPLREFQGSSEVSGDSWGGVRGEADLSVPFTEDGDVRGRLVLARGHDEGWVDNNDNDVSVGYGTMQADLTNMTTASLTISHMQRDIEPYNGLPTYADGTLLDIDRSTTTGADWNDFDNRVTDYIGELEHRFADGGHAKVSARYSDRDVDFLYGYAGSAAAANGDISSVSWLARDYEETSLALDSHISKPIRLFGQEHNVLVGADYQRFENTFKQGRGATGDTNNIFHWNTNLTRPSVTYSSQTETETDQYGLYGQVRIKPIDDLTLIGGGRSTWYQSETTDLLTSTQTGEQDVDAEFTPYAGVVYDLTETISPYVSYTEIFQPQSQVNASGQTLEPRQGSQYEAGVKASLLDGGLNASAAVFHLTDENRPMSDGAGNTVAGEEVEVEGVEFEVSGNIQPNWEVLAGYTYSRSEYVNGTNSGDVFSTYTPRHMAHLWTKYRFNTGGWMNDLFVGGGVKAFSDFKSISRGTTINADGYVVVDVMAGYDITDSVTATLTVNNLFDEKYYSRVGGASVFNFYGEPRSALLSLKAVF